MAVAQSSLRVLESQLMVTGLPPQGHSADLWRREYRSKNSFSMSRRGYSLWMAVGIKRGDV
jgi:hypothetical protein